MLPCLKLRFTLRWKILIISVSCITLGHLLFISIYLRTYPPLFEFRNINLTYEVTTLATSPSYQPNKVPVQGKETPTSSKLMNHEVGIAGSSWSSLWLQSAAALFKVLSDSQVSALEYNAKRLALSEQLHRHYQNYTPSSATVSRLPEVFEFPLNPANWSDCTTVVYLTVISSAPGHFDRRTVIRQTWAKDWHRLLRNQRTLFIVGQIHPANETIQQAIESEYARYGDVIQVNFTDSYRNLTRKTVALMQWTLDYCPNVRVLHKCDDDIFVHVPIMKEIVESLPDQNAVYGELIVLDKPHREHSNKYYLSEDVWPWSVLPPFLLGGSYLIGGRAISKLYNATRTMPLFPLEDVYITGICTGTAGVRRIASNKIYSQMFPNIIDACYLQSHASWQTTGPKTLQHSWNRVQLLKWKREHCDNSSLLSKLASVLG